MEELNQRMANGGEHAVTASELGSLVHHLVAHKLVFPRNLPELQKFVNMVSSLFCSNTEGLGKRLLIGDLPKALILLERYEVKLSNA